MLLKEILKEKLEGIFHYGSTFVTAIVYTKPIIDILIVVREIEKIDRYNEALAENRFIVIVWAK